MRSTGIFHPLFATHPRLGLETSMTDYIEIREPTGDYPTWVPGEPIGAGTYVAVYRGPARVQPNLDWRARDRKIGGELDATQAVRIQIPFGRNEVGATYDAGVIVNYGDDPFVAKDYIVHVISSQAESSESLQDYTFVVRNAIQASQKWLRNFLADTGTKVIDG